MPNELDYTAVAWGETHYYTLNETNLGYRFETSDAVFTFDLKACQFTLQPHRQTHRFFRAGLGALLFPILPLGIIYAKEYTLAGAGLFLFVLVGVMVVGLVLALRYRTIYSGHLLRTSNGDEVLIMRDPNNAECADAFIARLEALQSSPETR